MTGLVNQWFEQSTPFHGILACGLRHTDHTGAAKTWSDTLPEMAVENAVRCVSDVFLALTLNQIQSGRVRWVYQETLLHCERRADGTCLGVFTPRDEESFDQDGLDRLFTEFQALAAHSNA
jgi:hypothetical protein